MPIYKYQCLDCGNRSERLETYAEMLLHRETLRCNRCEGKLKYVFGVPAIVTESTFIAPLGDGFGDTPGARKHRRRALAKAKAAGVSTAGKVYFPQLCRPGVPCDPMAWIPAANARAEIRKRCEQMNYAAEGDISVKQREPLVDPFEGPYKVDDKIVEKEVDKIVAKEYGDKVSEKKRQELIEATSERLSGNQ